MARERQEWTVKGVTGSLWKRDNRDWTLTTAAAAATPTWREGFELDGAFETEGVVRRAPIGSQPPALRR